VLKPATIASMSGASLTSLGYGEDRTPSDRSALPLGPVRPWACQMAELLTLANCPGSPAKPSADLGHDSCGRCDPYPSDMASDGCVPFILRAHMIGGSGQEPRPANLLSGTLPPHVGVALSGRSST
jgi:hypothetical protein